MSVTTKTSLAGNFEAQCRQTFRNIEKTLAEAKSTLKTLLPRDKDYTEQTAAAIDEEVRKIVGGAMDRATAILETKETRLNAARGVCSKMKRLTRRNWQSS